MKFSDNSYIKSGCGPCYDYEHMHTCENQGKPHHRVFTFQVGISENWESFFLPLLNQPTMRSTEVYCKELLSTWTRVRGDQILIPSSLLYPFTQSTVLYVFFRTSSISWASIPKERKSRREIPQIHGPSKKQMWHQGQNTGFRNASSWLNCWFSQKECKIAFGKSLAVCNKPASQKAMSWE